MKVFVSWSGKQSHEIAKVLHNRLRKIIQSLDLWISSDIDAGKRWNAEIAKELSETKCGILCITRENIDKPWLLFEAGALAKAVDDSLVCPFLFDMKPSELDDPLGQFNAVAFDRHGVKKLVKTLNNASKQNGDRPLLEEDFDEVFDGWYPVFEKELKAIEPVSTREPDRSPLTEIEPEKVYRILEKVLDVCKTNQQLIRGPENNNEKTGKLESVVPKTSSKVYDLKPAIDRRVRVSLKHIMGIDDGDEPLSDEILLELMRSQITGSPISVPKTQEKSCHNPINQQNKTLDN